MARKKTNPKQPDLFAGGCPHHGPENVCNDCPGKLSTDGRGFVHPRDASGRVPVRRCKHCETYKTLESWSLTDYLACRDCATAVARANAAAARALKTGDDPVLDSVQEFAALGWERKAEEKTDASGKEIK